MKNKKILITAVDQPPGRGAYESLKIAGFRNLYTCDSNKNSYFNHIKKKKFYIVENAESKTYLSSIKKIVKKNKIEIIIPCIEPEVIFWSKNFKKLKNVKFLLPNNNTLINAIDKLKLKKIANELGITYPKTISLEKLKINSLNFPCILKPKIGWGMRGFYFVKNLIELRILYKKINKKKFIMQEYIRSNQQNIYAVGLLFDKNSNCKLDYCSKSTSTKYQLGGPATSGIIVKNRYLVSESIRLIKGLKNWSGPAMVEWIYSKKKNKFYLIDLNPRLWGYSILGTYNGLNFAENIVRILDNKKIIIKKVKKYKSFYRDFINYKI